MGKGTIRYGGYKVVFKISGERKKQSLKNAHRITLVSNFLLCCFLLFFLCTHAAFNQDYREKSKGLKLFIINTVFQSQLNPGPSDIFE